MWKYKCKTQFLTLLAAFLLGGALTFFVYRSPENIAYLSSMMPVDILDFILQNSYLMFIGGGLFFGGLFNVFILGSFLINEWHLSPFIVFFVAVLFPTIVLDAGILLFPVSLIVTLYGWLSLRAQSKSILKKRDIRNEDELIRIYLIHHSLDQQYEQMAKTIRKNSDFITTTYYLGIVTFFVVFLFVDNLWISIILILFLFFVYQFLARYKASLFLPISALLYEKCDPAACMSALIYYCQRGKHYKLRNQPLMAKCLIYMEDPSLAQDILATYPRPNSQCEMTYWSLMAASYYELGDEKGLVNCKEQISKLKLGLGRLSIVIKSEEQKAIQNKINLLNSRFTECKQYYLNQLKNAKINLTRADCFYYIALISFVEKDYALAKSYFEQFVSLYHGEILLKKARNYLDLIDQMNLDQVPEEQ